MPTGIKRKRIPLLIQRNFEMTFITNFIEMKEILILSMQSNSFSHTEVLHPYIKILTNRILTFMSFSIDDIKKNNKFDSHKTQSWMMKYPQC